MVQKLTSRVDSGEIPLKKPKRASLWVWMLIFENGLEIRRKKFDFLNHSNREWAEKTIIWAVNNDKSVEFLLYENEKH